MPISCSFPCEGPARFVPDSYRKTALARAGGFFNTYYEDEGHYHEESVETVAGDNGRYYDCLYETIVNGAEPLVTEAKGEGWAMEMRAFHTASGEVAYWVDAFAGPDAEWLVFLPGLTADHTLFDAQLAYFSGKANCLVWDAPAHGASRPYPLDFSMDDLARILHDILESEGIERPVLVGQSLGGYVSQAFIDLFPGEVAGFVAIDSAPLKRKYYPTWEVKALRHTKGMYQAIPWALLKPWGSWGTATTERGRAGMRSFMDGYTKREYVDLAAHGYRMLADTVESKQRFDIDCPALLLCGEKDHAGDVRPFNRKWAAGEGIPLVWVPGAGHNSNVDAPGFVNAQIEEFVASL